MATGNIMRMVRVSEGVLPKPRWPFTLSWYSPWSVTRPWLPRFITGCDEWHNLSAGVNIPFMGMVLLFRMRFRCTEGYEHLHMWTAENGWEGLEVLGCTVCRDIMTNHVE